MGRTLLGTSALVSVALLLSRLSGLIREQVLGARLGLSAEMDAAILILTLPDLLVGLLLSGGFAAALVPALTRASLEARIQLVRRVMYWSAVVGLGLAACLFLAMPWVTGALMPTTNVDQLTAFRLGFGLSLLALPISAVIGASSSYLNAVGKYAVSALAVLAFNGLLALYFLVGLQTAPVDFALFGAVVLGAVLVRLGLQASRMQDLLKRRPKIYRFEAEFPRQFLQGVLGATLIVGVPIVFRSLFALGGTGEMATFNYALRLFELPMGILITPIVVVFLPLLSDVPAEQGGLYRERSSLAVRSAFVLGLVGALVGAVFAYPIADLLFGFGALAGDSTQAIAATTQIVMIAIPFMAIFQATTTALNARSRTGYVLVYSLMALITALVLYAGVRLCGGQLTLSAQVGFVMFAVLASLLGLHGVFDGAGIWRCLRQLGVILLRTVGATGLFVWAWPIPLAEGFSFLSLLGLCGLGLILLAVNVTVLRELAAIRDQRSEV